MKCCQLSPCCEEIFDIFAKCIRSCYGRVKGSNAAGVMITHANLKVSWKVMRTAKFKVSSVSGHFKKCSNPRKNSIKVMRFFSMIVSLWCSHYGIFLNFHILFLADGVDCALCVRNIKWNDLTLSYDWGKANHIWHGDSRGGAEGNKRWTF